MTRSTIWHIGNSDSTAAGFIRFEPPHQEHLVRRFAAVVRRVKSDLRAPRDERADGVVLELGALGFLGESVARKSGNPALGIVRRYL